MNTINYNTPLVLSGPFKTPRQMLADQEYDGHKSLHDGEVAEGLGLKDAPIEGPTHFSQFTPMLTQIWGNEWYEKGCFSAHFQNMVIDGEEVKAFVEIPKSGSQITRCWAEKKDGTPVLEASASIGTTDETILEKRMARLRPYEKLVILADLSIGQKSEIEERVIMQPDQFMGNLYPFTLNEKLAKITEKSPFYSSTENSPYKKPIIPLEMVSVLGMYTASKLKWSIKQPVVGLFADLEVRMVNGPLLVGEEYLIKREIVALGESRQTEGYWTKSQFFDKNGQELIAEMLLHQAFFKHSYPLYPK